MDSLIPAWAVALEVVADKGTCGMTIDKSLKVKVGSIRSRNVLTRGERIAKLQETERWKEGDSVIGLPKVRVMKISLKKKKKAKAAEETAPGATPAAASAAPAPGGKKEAGPAKK
jgi:small basic protein (TIGR04137 family)